MASDHAGGRCARQGALYHCLIVVPTGHFDYDFFHAAGRNPYGVSAVVGDGHLDEHVLTLARHQAGRVTRLADALARLGTIHYDGTD